MRRKPKTAFNRERPFRSAKHAQQIGAAILANLAPSPALKEVSDFPPGLLERALDACGQSSGYKDWAGLKEANK